MIDLDAARAARNETEAKGPTLKLNGETYELAPEMPFGVLDAFREMGDPTQAAGALARVAKAILGEHYDAIVTEGGLSVDDVNELLDGAIREYGVTAPLPSPTS